MFDDIKIGIAGAGGLGSNCAFNLIRSGFKHFKIFDFDKVEQCNLNRQFYFYNQIGMPKVNALKENLLSINPTADIYTEQLKIDKNNINQLFNDCNVIVEAFDKTECKMLMINTFAKSDKLFVAASGMAGWGDFDKIRVKKLSKNFYIVGDFENEVTYDKPAISPRVNIVAALQADVILKYYMDKAILP